MKTNPENFGDLLSMYEFIAKGLSDRTIDSFLNGGIGIIHIENWNNDYSALEKIGSVNQQDYYNNTAVKVGGDDNIWQNLDMPWHSDRAYSEKIDDIAVLQCVDIEDSASPTLFCDMQTPVQYASEEILNAGKTEYWNKLSKYYDYAVYPVTYKKESHRRLHKRSKVKRPLIMEDKLGWFLTYNQAYTICEFSEEIEDLCYKSKYIYEHKWKKGDLLLFNNRKITHKRFGSESHIRRDLLRISLTAKDPICQNI